MIGLFIFCLVIAAIEFMLVIDLKPKAEIPLYVFLIGLIVLFIPLFNLIEVVIFGGLLITWCHDGMDLAGSNPISRFFKLLNKNI